MMIVGSDEYLIGDHFTAAIMYGDITGLDDSDEALLDKWLTTVLANPQYSDCGTAVECTRETTEFAKCAITGLMSLCTTVRVEYLKGDQ